jgi:hypothetical protein
VTSAAAGVVAWGRGVVAAVLVNALVMGGLGGRLVARFRR